MCKKMLALCTVVLTLMITAGCTAPRKMGDYEAGAYQSIHRKFSRMTAYEANIRLRVYSNQTERTYTAQQKVKLPDKARVEIESPASLAGFTKVYNGGQISCLPPFTEEALLIQAIDMADTAFLHEFFALYYQSEDTTVSVSTINGESQTLLLETMTAAKESANYKMTLLLDVKKMEPKVLTVYDLGGNVRMQTEFLSFQYNPALEDALFVI